MGGSDLYLVSEYAKNETLKDWLHEGLAMKSHFIASLLAITYFFNLTQRLRICLTLPQPNTIAPEFPKSLYFLVQCGFA